MMPIVSTIKDSVAALLAETEALIRRYAKQTTEYALLTEKVENAKRRIQFVLSELEGQTVLTLPPPDDPWLSRRIYWARIASYAATFLAFCSAGFFAYNTTLISVSSAALFWATLVASLVVFYLAFRVFATGLVARMLKVSTEEPRSIHRVNRLITISGVAFVIAFTVALLSQFVFAAADLLIIAQIGIEISLLLAAGGYSVQAAFWKEVQELCAEYTKAKQALGACEGNIRTTQMMMAFKLKEAEAQGIDIAELVNAPTLGPIPNPAGNQLKLTVSAEPAIGNSAINQEVNQ